MGSPLGGSAGPAGRPGGRRRWRRPPGIRGLWRGRDPTTGWQSVRHHHSEPKTGPQPSPRRSLPATTTTTVSPRTIIAHTPSPHLWQSSHRQHRPSPLTLHKPQPFATNAHCTGSKSSPIPKPAPPQSVNHQCICRITAPSPQPSPMRPNTHQTLRRPPSWNAFDDGCGYDWEQVA